MSPRKTSTKTPKRKSALREKTTSSKVTAAQVETSFSKTIQNNKVKAIIIGAAVVLLALLAFPFRFLITPAVVNGQPIFSWQYFGALHQKAGQQVLEQLISEKLIQQKITNLGIVVSQAEIDEQINQIESQLGEESGGLEALLATQGLSKDEFIKQLRLNLALEQLIKNSIEISEEDIVEELSTNAEMYEDLSEVDAATTAAENLRSDRTQEAFYDWFQQVRSQANIKNYFETPAETLPLQTSQ